jgi:UDP-glucose 4-epimerase
LKCAVLGGGGFIGSHLSEALRVEGCQVNIFDRQQARYFCSSSQKGINIFTGDFSNSKDLSRAISDCEVVYHLVSSTVPQTSVDNPFFDINTNLLSTVQLLDEARKARTKKIVFISSGGTVYGMPKEIPIKEDHPTYPINSYGICKLAIEKYLHLYWALYGLDYCVLRVSNAYGEGQSSTETQGLIATSILKALCQETLTIWGDGSVVRDYIYISDIISALLRARVSKGEPKVFNIGTGQGYSVKEIIGVIEQAVQKPLQIKYLPGRIFDVPVNILDVCRARTHLNWQPMIELSEGILRTSKWIQKQKYDQ